MDPEEILIVKCVTNLMDLMNFLSWRSARHIYSRKLFWLSENKFFLSMKFDNFKLALVELCNLRLLLVLYLLSDRLKLQSSSFGF